MGRGGWPAPSDSSVAWARGRGARPRLAAALKALCGASCGSRHLLLPPGEGAWVDGLEEPSGVEMYMNDVFTVPASMAGIPGISLPAGLSSDGLPLGVQLLGRPFDEVGLLRVAQALEDAAGFTATPQLMA